MEKQSKTRNEKSRFHKHPDTSVAIMAACLSLNIFHFYNTERENTDNLDCLPWTTQGEEVASHEADETSELCEYRTANCCKQ